MQKFLQFFSFQILRAKIHEKFTEVSLDNNKCCDFFRFSQLLVEVKNAKNNLKQSSNTDFGMAFSARVALLHSAATTMHFRRVLSENEHQRRQVLIATTNINANETPIPQPDAF